MSTTTTLDDRAPSIVYSAGWGQAGSASEHDHTTSFADTAGATAKLTFQGTSIGVYGTIPKQGSKSIFPVSSYSIDGSAPVQFNAVEDNKIQYSQRFFQSADLPSGTHTLTITNDRNSDPLYLDFFQVVMNPDLPTTSPVAPPPPPPPTSSPSPSSPTSPTSPPPPPPQSPASSSSPSAVASVSTLVSASPSGSTASASAASASTLTSFSISYSVSDGSTVPVTHQFVTVVTPTFPQGPATAPLNTADSGSTGITGGSTNGNSVTSGIGATKKSNAAAIAGGVMGGFIFILILLGVLLWRRRVQRRRNAFNNFRNRFGNFLGSKSDSFWAPVNDPSSNPSPRAQPLQALSPRSTPPSMSQAENTAFYPYTQTQSRHSGYFPGAAEENPAYDNPAVGSSAFSVDSASEISYHAHNYTSHAY